jgi:hypothetical protein
MHCTLTLQDTLRLMAHLMAGGFVVHVLAHFTASLQGPARLDQSLVRYFLGVVFTMALPRAEGAGYRFVMTVLWRCASVQCLYRRLCRELSRQCCTSV